MGTANILEWYKWLISLVFFVLFCFFRAGDWTQGCVQARQCLPLSYIPSPWFFWDRRISLGSPSWPGTRDTPAFVSQVLGLQLRATVPSLISRFKATFPTLPKLEPKTNKWVKAFLKQNMFLNQPFLHSLQTQSLKFTHSGLSENSDTSEYFLNS
jgi:hypothetical protein